MTPFRAMRRGYESRFEPVERAVLAKVARDVAALLRDEAGIGRAPAPERPWGPETGRPEAPARPGAGPGGLRAPDDLGGFGIPSDGDLARLTGMTGVGRVPSDPAALRLLPDASKDDADVAAEFRHLTQSDLARSKVTRLEALADLLDPKDAPERAVQQAGRHGAPPPVRVPREDAAAVAGALTDVRLVIAERLRLATDEDVERLTDEVMWDNQAGKDTPAADDDRAANRFWAGVFVAAGFAQESLVEVMLADLRSGTAQRGPSDPGAPEPDAQPGT